MPEQVGRASEVYVQRTSDSTVTGSRDPRSRSSDAWCLTSGARIANVRGVPGTLGSLAVTLHDGALVFLSSYHVLFGAGAREREAVWLVNGDTKSGRLRVGTSRYGKLGTVMCDGVTHYVDCAVAAIDDAPASAASEDEELGVAAIGTSVTKLGAGTGATMGVVVDTSRVETAVIDGRPREAPIQIVVRSAPERGPFSAKGDSGALLREESGRIVGLLWGTNARGESIACPIAPVLQILGIRLVRATSMRPTDAGS